MKSMDTSPQRLFMFMVTFASCITLQGCLAHGKTTTITVPKPLIIWWYDSIFPHVENEKPEVEIQCGELTCRASHDRKMVQAKEFQTIVFYGSDFSAYDVPLPRRNDQMWALLHEESPQNNFILTQAETLRLFNFSSTFKQSSDFPLTTQHIRSVEHLLDRKPLSIQEKNRYRQNGLAPVVYLQSHCDVPSDRDRYVKELSKYVDVDSYGECLHNKDFENEKLDETETMESKELYDILAKYKFHIAFENAICDDYVTEKLYRALHVGSVPLYMGAENVKELSPAQSLIRVVAFKSPAALAKLIRLLDSRDDAYERMLSYKKDKSSIPKKLGNILEGRTWSSYGGETVHFVQEFECYICEQMHKIQYSEKKPRTVPHSHLDCPAPKPATGSLESLSKVDGFHKWTEEFSLSAYEALALRNMITNNESDPERFWTYMNALMDDGRPEHTEL